MLIFKSFIYIYKINNSQVMHQKHWYYIIVPFSNFLNTKVLPIYKNRISIEAWNSAGLEIEEHTPSESRVCTWVRAWGEVNKPTLEVGGLRHPEVQEPYGAPPSRYKSPH